MRRRFVIAYDISADKRRTSVYELLLAYGDHVQYSVFVADLSERERIVLRTRLRSLINEREDQVIFVDVGPETRPIDECLEVLGLPYVPSVRTFVV